MMEEKTTPTSMVDVLANVRCHQTLVLQTEAEQKQLADKKFKDEQDKFLEIIMRQITLRSCNKYIIFEVPKPKDKRHMYDTPIFALKQIYNTFDKEYCLYNVVRNRRSIGNMSPNYQCTRITMNKDGYLQNKQDTTTFMLYDKRRFKTASIATEIPITSVDFEEYTK